MNSLINKILPSEAEIKMDKTDGFTIDPKIPNRYRELIKEAFLDPIRTAVIVDDEFPTLEDFLDQPAEVKPGNEVQWGRKLAQFGRVRSILDVCRNQRPHPWIVDVHDGRTPSLDQERETVSHMDHTDLLVLDYHLDPTNSGDKAISILRKLASNSHFNLVVIYTQTRNEHGLNQTIDDIALGLTKADPRLTLNGAKINAFERRFYAAVGKVGRDIEIERLIDQIDDLFFVLLLSKDNRSFVSNSDQPQIAFLVEEVRTLAQTGEIREEECWSLILHYKVESVVRKMAQANYGQVFADRSKPGVNWIRADSIFVTVISKDFVPETIPEKLLDALEAWNPAPHRLMLTKMRSEIGKHGVVAEAQALANTYLHAGWLQELLENNEAKRRTKVRLGVARHWESLGGRLTPHIFQFADKLALHLSEKQQANQAGHSFELSAPITDIKEVRIHLNAYACSKNVEGHHLFTGQIFCLGERDKTYWLCLTPACDLEPGQRDGKGWNKRLGEWLPFKAVRLYDASKDVALREATRGYHIFANIEGSVAIFGFAQELPDDQWSTPTLGWEQFFANNQGIFTDNGTFEVASVGRKSDIDTEIKPAKVVAQLRYEYALNLNQRLGAHLSRVGLDFISYREQI